MKRVIREDTQAYTVGNLMPGVTSRLQAIGFKNMGFGLLAAVNESGEDVYVYDIRRGVLTKYINGAGIDEGVTLLVSLTSGSSSGEYEKLKRRWGIKEVTVPTLD